MQTCHGHPWPNESCRTEHHLVKSERLTYVDVISNAPSSCSPSVGTSQTCSLQQSSLVLQLREAQWTVHKVQKSNTLLATSIAIPPYSAALHSLPLEAHLPGPSAQVRLNDYCDSLALRHEREIIAISKMLQKVRYVHDCLRIG